MSEKKVDSKIMLFEQMRINNALLTVISRDLRVIRDKILGDSLSGEYIKLLFSKPWEENFWDAISDRTEDLQRIKDQLCE